MVKCAQIWQSVSLNYFKMWQREREGGIFMFLDILFRMAIHIFFEKGSCFVSQDDLKTVLIWPLMPGFYAFYICFRNYTI